MSALTDARARARLSGGTSHEAIYRMIRAALNGREVAGLLVDVGCGHARLREHLRGLFDRYIGIDVEAYAGLTRRGETVIADVERALPLVDGVADLVVAAETIEHLENPRAFVRELARIVRPGGHVLVTTPNQLSALSLLSLIFKGRFASFQDVHYPAHRTALLEIDLRRIVTEAGLVELRVVYSGHSRLPLTAVVYPSWVARCFPTLLSDNVLIMSRRPPPGTE